MPSDSAPTSFGKNGHASPKPAPVVVIASDPSCSGEMLPMQRSALAAADVVLHEEDVDPTILTLVRRGVFVELVAADGHATLTKASGIARARKLAGEGWRVVLIISGDAKHFARDFADAGLVVGDRGAADALAIDDPEPHHLATPLNGLAG
jgi:hypothetical protein